MIQGRGRPIFVVGASRSGTSAISLGLMRGAGLPGYHEGHVFPLLKHLHKAIDDYFDAFDEEALTSVVMMIGSLDPQALKDHITSWFVRLFEERLGVDGWVDKTPDARMLNAVPDLAKIYPQGQFVFAKRRGIENVMSRIRKFPERTLEHHCRIWATAMAQWRLVRDALPEGCYVEIDQHDLALYPEDTARRLGAFLGLSQEQIDRIGRFWLTGRPEQTRAAQDYRYIGLDETGWSEDEKAIFVRVCGSLMKQYGYALEGQRFPEARRQPVYLYYPRGQNKEIRTENVLEQNFMAVDQGFLLHPNGPKAPLAKVRYSNLEFFGHNHFSAVLSLNNPEAEPVEFRLSIEYPGDPVPFFESSIEVAAGQDVPWDVPLPALEGPCEVVISTAMASGAASNRYARALWKESRFSMEEAAYPL